MLKRAIAVNLLLAIPVWAQAPPSFEVASVKPNKSGDFRRGLGPEPGGRFVAINVPLRDLVALAYGISNLDAESRVIGGPEWMARERFDVTAKAAGAPAPSEYPPTGRTIPGTITATALSIGSLAGGPIRFAGRSVVDETGLAGYYDYELRWTPDQPPEPRPGEPPLVIDPNGPSLSTALQEQLGLRLESRRVPMKVVVIDHAESPTPD
jgi:hypothetical protein